MGQESEEAPKEHPDDGLLEHEKLLRPILDRHRWDATEEQRNDKAGNWISPQDVDEQERRDPRKSPHESRRSLIATVFEAS